MGKFLRRSISLVMALSMILTAIAVDAAGNTAFASVVKQNLVSKILLADVGEPGSVDPDVENERIVPRQVNVHMGDDPSTSVNFTYTTLDEAPSTVVLNKIGDDEKLTFTGTSGAGSANKYFHGIIADGLEPDTEYEYTAGTGVNTYSGKFKTALESGSKESFKFVYLADTQVSNATDAKALGATLQEVADSDDVSFVYIAGDVTDTATSEPQWEFMFNNGGSFPNGGQNMFGSKLLSVVQGNHDNNTMNRHINAPAEEGNIVYSFDYGSATFVMLNLEEARYSTDARDKQKEFLIEKVNEAKERGQWVIVGFHKSLITGASHITDSDVVEARKYWIPVFAELDVDFVLQGHDHVYSRGFVTGDGSRAFEEKIETGETVVSPQNAPLYMIGGHAGGLKWYSKKNYVVQPNDPLLPGYTFLDKNSTDDQSDIKKEQVIVEVEIDDKAVEINTYMFKYDTASDTITTEKYLYDSITVTRADVIATLSTEDEKSLTDLESSIELNLEAKDKNGVAIDLTDAEIEYKVSKEGLISVVTTGSAITTGAAITTGGSITAKVIPIVIPERNEVVSVYAEVTIDEETYKSNSIKITVGDIPVLTSVELKANGQKLLTGSEDKINLSVDAKDKFGEAINADDLTIEYISSKDGILDISSDGTVTIKNAPVRNQEVKITAEVSNGTETVKSNTILVNVILPEFAMADGNIAVSVKSEEDDVEERADGSLDEGSSDLEIVQEKTNQTIGIRFTDLAIPKGAKILDAYIEFTVDEPDKGTNPFDVNIRAEAVADSPAFQNINKNISSRALTKNTVNWKDIPLWVNDGSSGIDQQTPNIASLIQEVIDMDGWKDNNAMTFVINGIGNRSAKAFESSPSEAPRLYVTFIKDPSNIKLELPIKVAADDVEETADGSLDGGSSDLEIVDESTNQVIGLRFQDVSVPKGAKIIDAYVQFTVDEIKNSKNSENFNVNIQAEDTDNSTPYEYNEAVLKAVSSRNRTKTTVEWKDIPKWEAEQLRGVEQRTPDISSLIQEIVNKEGWESGNALSLILSGSGTRTAEAHEGAANVAERPTLNIVYSLADNNNGGNNGGSSGGGSKKPPVVEVPESTDLELKADTAGKVVVTPDKLKNADSLTIKGDIDITFDKDALASIGTDDNLSVSIKKADASKLTAADKALIGNRPIFEITVMSGTKSIIEFGGDITISIPYELAQREDADYLRVYYINDSGIATRIKNSYYDEKTKSVIFVTNHFSMYTVGYSEIEFNDVDGWAEQYIYYLADRNVIGGRGNGIFGPNDSITRAEFVRILAGAADVDLSKYSTSKFTDVKPNDWFETAVAWASETGITSGMSDNSFEPNNKITREQMAVMIARFAEKIKYPLIEKNASAAFADQAQISAYAVNSVDAVQKAGIMAGKLNNKFDPAGNATRAEASKVLAVMLQNLGK